MKTSEALDMAAIIIRQGWIQRGVRREGAYCALGALIVVCDGDWDLYYRATYTLAGVIPAVPGVTFPFARCIACWNDSLDPAVGQSATVNALRKAARVAQMGGD
jgi:hypothetical protein